MIDLKMVPDSKWYKDIFRANYISRKPIYDFMMKYKMLHGKLLDYGAGSMPYKKIFSEVEEYVGLDYDETGKRFFYDSCESDVVYYDGVIIPFSDEVFDVVISNQVLEHVEDEANSLNEITRVLKKGGVLLLTIPHLNPHHMSPFDFRRFTIWGIEQELKKRGYSEIVIEGSTSRNNTNRRVNILCCKSKLTPIVSCINNINYVVEYVFMKIFNRPHKDNNYMPMDILVYAIK